MRWSFSEDGLGQAHPDLFKPKPGTSSTSTTFHVTFGSLGEEPCIIVQSPSGISDTFGMRIWDLDIPLGIWDMNTHLERT